MLDLMHNNTKGLSTCAVFVFYSFLTDSLLFYIIWEFPTVNIIDSQSRGNLYCTLVF